MDLGGGPDELDSGHVRHLLIDQENSYRPAFALELIGKLERLVRRARRNDGVGVAIAGDQVALEGGQHLGVVVHAK
jgi:hypothetical protein